VKSPDHIRNLRWFRRGILNGHWFGFIQGCFWSVVGIVVRISWVVVVLILCPHASLHLDSFASDGLAIKVYATRDVGFRPVFEALRRELPGQPDPP